MLEREGVWEGMEGVWVWEGVWEGLLGEVR